MKVRYRITLFLVVIFFATGIGFLCGQKSRIILPTEPPKTKVDTLVIRDTLTRYEPIFKETRVVEKQLVKVTDTLSVHDTLYVYLDREQVVWQDSLSVVYASGILPQVDSVRYFISHQIISTEVLIPEKVRSKWGLGFQVGMGVGRDGLLPYIGVGVSYNILSW